MKTSTLYSQIGKAMALIGLMFTSLSFAQPSNTTTEPPSETRLPSVEETLQRARVSRVEYIKVLGEIERVAPEIQSSAKLYPYIMILDSLQVIGTQLKMDEFVGSPLQITAKVLTAEAVKFMNFSTDDSKLITTFIKWAKDDVRENAVRIQFSLAALAETKSDLKLWMKVISNLSEMLKTYKAAYYVHNSLETLQAGIFRKLFENKEQLTHSEFLHLIQQTISVQPLQEILEYLEQMSFDTKDPGEMNELIEFLLEADQSLKAFIVPTPIYVMRYPANVTLVLLRKLSQVAAPIPLGYASSISSMLEGVELTDISKILFTLNTSGFQKVQSDFWIELCEHLNPRYEEKGLKYELEISQHLLAKLYVAQMGVANLEGHYRINIEGQQTTMTIAALGNGDLIAGITAVDGPNLLIPFDLSFFQISYNLKKGVFEANRYYVEHPREGTSDNHNHTMLFTLAKNQIKGRLKFADRNVAFSGTRISALDIYVESNSAKPLQINTIKNFTGAFRATNPATGEVIDLNISQAGTQVIANINFSKMKFHTNLNFLFFDANRSGVNMTSPELMFNKSWIQLRGTMAFEGEQVQSIRADILFGGRGAKLTKLDFKRLSE